MLTTIQEYLKLFEIKTATGEKMGCRGSLQS
jgi:hypothetical protein